MDRSYQFKQQILLLFYRGAVTSIVDKVTQLCFLPPTVPSIIDKVTQLYFYRGAVPSKIFRGTTINLFTAKITWLHDGFFY